MGLFGGVAGNNDSHELNEGKLIPDDHDAAIKSSENVNDEGLLLCLLLVLEARYQL